MTKKELIKKWKKDIAIEFFGGVCFVCNKKYGKAFHFHHLKYRENEKTYRDFTNNDTYQYYILPIIKSRPFDFKLLCNKHHYLVEILKRFKEERLERLFIVVRKSK